MGLPRIRVRVGGLGRHALRIVFWAGFRSWEADHTGVQCRRGERSRAQSKYSTAGLRSRRRTRCRRALSGRLTATTLSPTSTSGSGFAGARYACTHSFARQLCIGGCRCPPRSGEVPIPEESVFTSTAAAPGGRSGQAVRAACSDVSSSASRGCVGPAQFLAGSPKASL